MRYWCSLHIGQRQRWLGLVSISGCVAGSIGEYIMKIVTQTQVRENYGAHAWNGTGECPQHWKMKGGKTYIIEDVTVDQASSKEFWDLIPAAIQFSDESWEEYILSSDLIDDVEKTDSFHASWESPVILRMTTRASGPVFKATREHTDIHKKHIAKKVETWFQSEGDRKDFTVVYVTNDGNLLDWQGDKLVGSLL